MPQKRIQYDTELFDIDNLVGDERKGTIKIIEEDGKTKLIIECYIDAKNPDPAIIYNELPEILKIAYAQTFRVLATEEKLGAGGVSIKILPDDDENNILNFSTRIKFKPPDGSGS